MRRNPAVATILAPLLLLAGGCRPPTDEATTAWKEVAEGDLTPEQIVQRDQALTARDAMFTALKGRLTDAVGSEGLPEAIAVCSKEAPQIAQRVSQEHGLRIGRTSFRLRNPKNAAPEWAEQLVADQVAQPTYLTQEGKFAALLPIRLQAQCLMCHGPEGIILTEVKDALAKHYPKDEATGFQDGDLRGWFYVEVPGSDGS